MMDLDNMTQITECRNQMAMNSSEGYNKFSTDGTTLMGPKTMNLKQQARPKLPPGGIVTVFIIAIIPAVVQFIVLMTTKGALTTISAVTGTYTILIMGHFYLVDKKAWMALREQDIKPSMTSGKFKTDFFMTLSVAGLAFSIVSILYSGYIPFGPAEIDVYLPSGNTFMRIVYWLIYLSIQIAILPAVETAFFFFLILYYVHYSMPMNGALAIIYGLTQFSWIVMSIWGVGWIIFLTLGCTALGWLYLVAVRRESFLKGLGMRYGVGVGLGIYLLVLNFFIGSQKISSPQQYNTSW